MHSNKNRFTYPQTILCAIAPTLSGLVAVGCADLGSNEEGALGRSQAEVEVSSEPAEYMSVETQGSGPVSIDQRATRRKTTPVEARQVETERGRLPEVRESRASKVPERSTSERTIEHAKLSAPDALIEVSIELREEPFAFEGLVRSEPVRRSAMIQDRKVQLGKSQEGLSVAIRRMGGRELNRGWLVNVVDAEVPAKAVAEIASLPGVVAVSFPEEVHNEQSRGWNGRLIRRGLKLDSAALANSKSDFYVGCFGTTDPDTCHDGNTNSRMGADEEIRLAMVESGSGDSAQILRNHVGWRDGTSATNNRVRLVYNCGSSGCTTTTSSGTENNHGTRVSWVAAGSLEQGQDSAYPLSDGARTTDQRNRSGVAKEAGVYYYLGSTTTGLRLGIEQAVADGADVINMSWGGAVCSSVTTYSYDSGSINAALRNALSAGALPVKSAGNEGDDGSTCTTTYPGWRPDVLTAGGLQSDDNVTDMNDLGLYTSSSRGGATLRIMGSTTNRTFGGVDLMAPACIDLYFSNDSTGYSTTKRCGTSYAAPAVTGTAGLMRDALNHLGWSGNNAKALMVNMLLFGDAWESDTGANRTTGVGRASGFGRVHAHWPTTDNLTAPWGWGWRARTINEGETLTWTVGGSDAESTSVTQWKWAVTWFDSDLENSSDIVIRVRDTCAGNVVVASDVSYDFRKRIQLRQSQIGGKCLEMEAQAIRTPSGGTTFYSADYYHSGDAEVDH